jgi:mono/diheme cytochrome c family protein
MIFALKIVLAALLFLAGGCAAGTRLWLDGRIAPARKPGLLRLLHAWAGWTFAACLLLETGLGLLLLARGGDSLPLRGVLHWHLALVLDVLFLAKIGFLKKFRALRGWVPKLGLWIAGTSLVVVFGALGFAVLSGSRSSPAVEAKAGSLPTGIEAGRQVFAGLCAGCHSAAPEANSQGPNLNGLFRRMALPASGRPATEENVRLQLRRPFRSMPALSALSEAETDALLAYLRSL